MNENARVALAGDWATGTDESAEIATQITKHAPEFTIHLGDVYFVGDERSIAENCRDQRQANGYDPVRWPPGSVGSFAMNGNHEAYARDNAYFDWIGAEFNQSSSCFCLHNRSWWIIGLDTGYNSEGIPFLGSLAERYDWKSLMPSCALPIEAIKWLEKSVVPQISGDEAIILLTHHQYVSSFEIEYPRAAEQLSHVPAFKSREMLWFWGHEHRLAGYGLSGNSGIKAFGRCLGHGGMPVERGVNPKSGRPLQFYDDRSYDPNTGQIVSRETDFGVNGYVLLEFDGTSLKVEYRDIKDTLSVLEVWKAVGGNARLISQQCDPSRTVTPPFRDSA
jgi:hypothetical protein